MTKGVSKNKDEQVTQSLNINIYYSHEKFVNHEFWNDRDSFGASLDSDLPSTSLFAC